VLISTGSLEKHARTRYAKKIKRLYAWREDKDAEGLRGFYGVYEVPAGPNFFEKSLNKNLRALRARE